MENQRTKHAQENGETTIKEKCLKIITLIDELNGWLSGSDLEGKVKMSR